MSRLDWVKEHWDRYCNYIRKDPAQCYHEVSAQFLKGFFSWVCDQRRGKGGRRRPGIKHTSSLETFWKWYQLVYKIEAGRKIDDLVIAQTQDVVKIVALEKGLINDKRESATMYVHDLAEYARVLLATTKRKVGRQEAQIYWSQASRPKRVFALMRHVHRHFTRHCLSWLPGDISQWM